MNNEKVLIVVIVLAVAAALTFMAYQTFRFGSNYQNAIASEQTDICATHPGYTDESWREHMSHHPDRYAECLQK